jgi:hypothetical protein
MQIAQQGSVLAHVRLALIKITQLTSVFKLVQLLPLNTIFRQLKVTVLCYVQMALTQTLNS